MIPLDYPITKTTRVSQSFAERPEFYQPLGFKGHPGIDYAVPEGTPVLCAFWGEVIEIGASPTGWGIYIKVNHGQFVTLYAHLSGISAVRGCYVTKGQKLASSGNTGLSSGPHLHFGVLDPANMNNGYKGYVDPAPFFETQSGDCQSKLDRILAEVAQIEKEKYTGNSVYIHTEYIKKICRGV
jgi:murein DD-endopeptidase MepM/ murein hydrolase activator NlpD